MLFDEEIMKLVVDDPTDAKIGSEILVLNIKDMFLLLIPSLYLALT